MVVKNQSRVIRRCLKSVKDLINYWVIVDTGSDDGTKQIIKDFLREIPGELHERPQADFADQRREALDASRTKADYILLINPDDRLVFFEDFFMPELEEDIYCVLQREKTGDLLKENYAFLFVKNDIEFEWKSGLHEFLRCRDPRTIKILTNLIRD
jgi:glycosyltransferase involved in cell wall biosynthesis